MAESVLQRVMSRLRPARIDTLPSLRTFLEQRAALIAQKCAIDYCRGKTGLASHALFTEKTFLDALEICRWETYVAVLADLMLIVEGRMRGQLPQQQQSRLGAALAALYAESLAAMPPPAYRTQGWSDAVQAFEARLRSAATGKPLQALDVADHSAKRLFDTLPIHSRYRELDEEPVYGSVRFRMIAVSQEMGNRFEAEALAKALTA